MIHPLLTLRYMEGAFGFYPLGQRMTIDYFFFISNIHHLAHFIHFLFSLSKSKGPCVKNVQKLHIYIRKAIYLISPLVHDRQVPCKPCKLKLCFKTLSKAEYNK